MDKQAFDLMMSRFDGLEKGISDLKTSIKDQNGRVRSLEDTRSHQRGIMAAGGVAVTVFSGFATWVVNHLWPTQ